MLENMIDYKSSEDIRIKKGDFNMKNDKPIIITASMGEWIEKSIKMVRSWFPLVRIVNLVVSHSELGIVYVHGFDKETFEDRFIKVNTLTKEMDFITAEDWYKIVV